MAVVTTKSTRISNAEAASQTLDTPGVNHGKLRRVAGTVEVASTDSSTSKFIMFRVHSSWTIASLRIFCDALGGSCAGDVGLYQCSANPANGGAVVDVDAYASAQTLVSAIKTGTEIAYEARDIANLQQKVYQDAGLTTDPGRWYDVAVTLTADAASAGTLCLEGWYVANE